MNLEFLKHKKIAIAGLGVNNQKMAEYLKKNSISYSVIKQWSDPAQLVGKLDQFDIVFRTPGLPFMSAAVQQVIKRGGQVQSQTKLFFRLCPCPIIGVTGTKGKGTTAALVYKILAAAGKKVWLAGNIGADPFEFLDQIGVGDLVVYELSSFQLQDLEQSPQIAVVLAITSDHLNHHASLEEYIRAKTSILKFQKKNDLAVLSPDLPDWFSKLGQATKFFYNPEDVGQYSRKLLGQHNLTNIAAASLVGKILGIDEAIIKKAVAEFEPLPHRLKVISVVRGVSFVDDAFSTNIEPTVAAIRTFQAPLILILGGFDKGLEFAELGRQIRQAKNIKALILIGEVADKILHAVAGFGGRILTGAKNMSEILAQARSVATAGDTVLFSPATASFDMFQNELDRGERFVAAVEGLR